MWQEYQSFLLVKAHQTPDISSRAIFPALTRPGIIADFAGMRNGVEPPYLLARVYIPGPRIARGTGRGRLLDLAASDHQVLVDRDRRRDIKLRIGDAVLNIRLYIDAAILTEASRGLSGLRIYRP